MRFNVSAIKNMAILKWIYYVVLFEHLLSGTVSGAGASSGFAFPSDEDSVGK